MHGSGWMPPARARRVAPAAALSHDTQQTHASAHLFARPPIMHIVVTGSAGRIGRHVVRDLRRHGHRVTGIDSAPPTSGSGPGHMRVDLTQAGQVYGALAGADAVAHLGAWPNPGLVPDTRTYSDNVTGTYHVLQACADLGIRRVVTSSSAQVYGFFEHDPVYAPVDEAHPLRPLNSYAASKIAGETAVDYFVQTHGLEACSFRIMAVRASAEIPAQVADIRADPARHVGLLWTRTDARDAAAAFRLAIESETAPTGTYNITGPEVATDEDVPDLLAAHCPQTEMRDGLDERRSPLSIERAHHDFGYDPRYAWTGDRQHPDDEEGEE
jgi:nucleoside-diphosphate-sugar epimerase